MFRQARTKQPVNLRMSGCDATACQGIAGLLPCENRMYLLPVTAGFSENDMLSRDNRKENVMSNSNSSSNRATVPQAREALNRFKMEVANEIGVPLKEGYNGDLTSAQNGSVGGEMVRQMIRRQEEAMSNGSK